MTRRTTEVGPLWFVAFSGNAGPMPCTLRQCPRHTRSGSASMRRLLYLRFGIAAALCSIVAIPQAPGQSDAGIQVYQNVLKSTVWIQSDRGGGALATGSGSLIDRRRCLILTNYHVVGNIDRVMVFFPAYRD